MTAALIKSEAFMRRLPLAVEKKKRSTAASLNNTYLAAKELAAQRQAAQVVGEIKHEPGQQQVHA